jgi:hypothetical protein
VDWVIYAALIAAALATLGATIFLVVRGLQGWRDFKRLRRHLAKALQALADVAERTSQSAERVSDQSALEESLRRLRISLATMNVLTAALDEVDETFRRVTAVVPRK